MNIKTTLLKRLKKSLSLGVFGLFLAVPAFAHEEDGFGGFMDGWNHWGMMGGWMWVFPALFLALLVLGVVALTKTIWMPTSQKPRVIEVEVQERR